MTRNTGKRIESSGEIEAQKVESGADDEIGDLRDCLCSNKGTPVICFGLLPLAYESHTQDRTHLFLASLEDIAVLQEERLHLIDATRGHENEVEDSEQSQLKGERAVIDLPEGETTKEARKDVKHNLIPHIVLKALAKPRQCVRETYWRPPDLNAKALGDHFELEPMRARIICSILGVDGQRRMIQRLQGF